MNVNNGPEVGSGVENTSRPRESREAETGLHHLGLVKESIDGKILRIRRLEKNSGKKLKNTDYRCECVPDKSMDARPQWGC
jgi:hypothetical protein